MKNLLYTIILCFLFSCKTNFNIIETIDPFYVRQLSFQEEHQLSNDYTDFPSTYENYIELIEQSGAKWNLDFTYDYITSVSKKHQHKIIFSNVNCNSYGFTREQYEECMASNPRKELAYCSAHWDKTNIIQYSVIVVFIQRIDAFFEKDFNEQFKRILAHEIGHCIGLLHTKNDRDIMYNKLHHVVDVFDPNQNELEAVQSLYVGNKSHPEILTRFQTLNNKPVKRKDLHFSVVSDFNLLLFR